jgi:hypothetical protein
MDLGWGAMAPTLFMELERVLRASLHCGPAQIALS